MINYVNNAYDKVLKPCDAQKFSIIVNSKETEKHILGHRGGDAKAKSKLPALTYMGVLDSDKYKAYLKTLSNSLSMGRTQTSLKQGTRKAEFMRPTGLLMLDFDHITEQATDPLPTSPSMGRGFESPTAMWEQIYKGASERGFDLGQCLALAHITPSGDGLRLVVTRDKGKTIAEGQYHWVQEVLPWLGVNVKCDDVCKDISRLSFAPMQKEILYFNPSLLFAELPNAGDYPDGSLFSGVKEYRSEGVKTIPVTMNNSADELSSSLLSGAKTPKLLNSYETEYNGVSYSDIVARLEEQLGGRPAQGARNSFIFTMACNLRYICNDDAQWVASILPTYGEEPQKHRMTIQSAINRPMSKTMPETLARALNVCKMGSEGDPQPSTLGSACAAIGSPRADTPAHLAHSGEDEGSRGHGGVSTSRGTPLRDGVHVHRQPPL